MSSRRLATALLSLGLLLCAATPAAGEPLRLTIAFTGDVSGYLDPCG